MSEEPGAIGKGQTELDDVTNKELVARVAAFRSDLTAIDFKTLNDESSAALAGLATDLQKAMQSHKERLAINALAKQTHDYHRR